MVVWSASVDPLDDVTNCIAPLPNDPEAVQIAPGPAPVVVHAQAGTLLNVGENVTV